METIKLKGAKSSEVEAVILALDSLSARFAVVEKRLIEMDEYFAKGNIPRPAR